MVRESRGEKARRQIIDLNISGLSNAEIARRAGVHRSQVGRWLKGQTNPRKGGKSGNLTRLWKRTNKVLGEGGTVNLSSFFRRVWVKDSEAILPLNIATLPTYNWPPNAPVAIMAKMSYWELESGINWDDKILSSNFSGSLGMKHNSNRLTEITDALLTALAEMVYDPVRHAAMDFVLLRWGKN